MARKLNDRAATMIVKMLRGESSYEEARRVIKPRKHVAITECRIGANGVCLTHGQVMSDCEKRDE